MELNVFIVYLFLHFKNIFKKNIFFFKLIFLMHQIILIS
jgi:hypothetical protein